MNNNRLSNQGNQNLSANWQPIAQNQGVSLVYGQAGQFLQPQQMPMPYQQEGMQPQHHGGMHYPQQHQIGIQPQQHGVMQPQGGIPQQHHGGMQYIQQHQGVNQFQVPNQNQPFTRMHQSYVQQLPQQFTSQPIPVNCVPGQSGSYVGGNPQALSNVATAPKKKILMIEDPKTHASVQIDEQDGQISHPLGLSAAQPNQMPPIPRRMLKLENPVTKEAIGPVPEEFVKLEKEDVDAILKESEKKKCNEDFHNSVLAKMPESVQTGARPPLRATQSADLGKPSRVTESFKQGHFIQDPYVASPSCIVCFKNGATLATKTPEDDLTEMKQKIEKLEDLSGIERKVCSAALFHAIRDLVNAGGLNQLKCSVSGSQKTLRELAGDVKMDQVRDFRRSDVSNSTAHYKKAMVSTSVFSTKVSTPQHGFNRRTNDEPIPRRAVTRGSLDRNTMQRPVEKVEIPITRSATAWKPKREQTFDTEEAKYLKKKQDIRGLLNKVTPSNYDDINKEFCDFKVHLDGKMFVDVIDMIFEKAVEEPRFCPIYADLCHAQVVSEGQLSGSQLFRKELLQKCQRIFSLNELKEEMKVLSENIASVETELDKRQESENRLSVLKTKRKQRAIGVIKLIAQLYRLALLHNNVICYVISELIKDYKNSLEAEYLEFAVSFFMTVGPIFDNRKDAHMQAMKAFEKEKNGVKIVRRGADQTAWRPSPDEEARKAEEKRKMDERKASLDLAQDMIKDVEKIYGTLVNQRGDFPQRINILLWNLADIRKSGWKENEIDQGPKTREQLQEENEIKEQKNLAERQAYNNQQNKNNTYSGRGSSRSTVPAGQIFHGTRRNSPRNDRSVQGNQPENKRIVAAENASNAPATASAKTGKLAEVANTELKPGRKSAFNAPGFPWNKDRFPSTKDS